MDDVTRTALANLIVRATEGLPAHDVDDITVLVRAGELQVALENLCTQLFEYDVHVSPALWRELVQAGRCSVSAPHTSWAPETAEARRERRRGRSAGSASFTATPATFA